MILEFEKPIHLLETKLEEMKRIAEESGVDVSKDIKSLESKIEFLKKETFANLTRWQRVQLSRHPERPYTRIISMGLVMISSSCMVTDK